MADINRVMETRIGISAGLEVDVTYSTKGGWTVVRNEWRDVVKRGREMKSWVGEVTYHGNALQVAQRIEGITWDGKTPTKKSVKGLIEVATEVQDTLASIALKLDGMVTTVPEGLIEPTPQSSVPKKKKKRIGKGCL